MMQGYGSNWLEMVSDLLAKKEYGLEYTALTDYYRFLDEYLDNQLEPTGEVEEDDYVESIIPDPIPEENEIPSSAEAYDKTSKEPNIIDNNPIRVETHSDIMKDNIIETGEETNMKFGIETSTVGVLEIKNPVSAGDTKDEVNIKEASYNTYWWIGIGVAVAVVVILIAIILRKRQSHRKELDRQRRENSRA